MIVWLARYVLRTGAGDERIGPVGTGGLRSLPLRQGSLFLPISLKSVSLSFLT